MGTGMGNDVRAEASCDRRGAKLRGNSSCLTGRSLLQSSAVKQVPAILLQQR